MKFYVLGSLEIVGGSGPLTIRAKRLRAMLAILLLHPSRVVSMDRIIDDMWPGVPPQSAVENIRTYAWQLRSLLHSAGDDGRLESHPGGYRLVADPEELDLLRFTTLAAGGRRALQLADYGGAAVLLEQAMKLWRGDALPELDLGPGSRAKTAALEEERWQVGFDWISARLALGEHAELVAVLRELVAERPLDEGLWRYLVVTLYSIGRTADALAAYAEARNRLVSELGIEPGPELRKVQDAILSGNEVPSVPPRAPAATAQDHRMIPRQLPGSDGGFVGRESVLGDVRKLVSDLQSGNSERRAVVTVSGPPGVGKSAVAIAAATAVRSEFPDGQLYVDLRGSTDEPLGAAEALASVLDGFGIRPDTIPRSVDRCEALYRSLLAERRMLLLIDDAASAAQVEPLIPGPGQSLLLVTSRRRLAGIAADLRISLEPLSSSEALGMLGGIVGTERVVSEPAASLEIVEACSRLPLAIRIAGGCLVARPEHPLRTFRDRVSDNQILDELSLDGLAMRERFDASYRALDPAARRCFRMLGMLGSDHITAAALGELLHLPARAADRELEPLVQQGLLTPETVPSGPPIQVGPPRYRMLTLLHLYARERLAVEGPQLRVA